MERGSLDVSGLWQEWLRPWTQFAAPLSGDVTQAIEPSFIRVTAQAAGDPRLEREIVEEVASYGRQLGRILDALVVLVTHADGTDFNEAERAALDDLITLSAEIEAAKNRSAVAQADRIVGEIGALRRGGEGSAEALARIRAALDGE